MRCRSKPWVEVIEVVGSTTLQISLRTPSNHSDQEERSKWLARPKTGPLYTVSTVLGTP